MELGGDVAADADAGRGGGGVGFGAGDLGAGVGVLGCGGGAGDGALVAVGYFVEEVGEGHGSGCVGGIAVGLVGVLESAMGGGMLKFS